MSVIPLLVVLGLCGVMVLVFALAPRSSPPSPQQVRMQQQQAAQYRLRMQQEAQKRQDHNARSRAMQIAIICMAHNDDPDFRRAAHAAQEARTVPEVWRRRQFRRLRPLIVQHYRRCRERRRNMHIVRESLDDLVLALGIQIFEADYIHLEAFPENARPRPEPQKRKVPKPPNPSNEFQQRLARLQTDHAQRMQAIRETPGLDEGVRRQLLEAEERRFHIALFGEEDYP
ncbi:MAG: hypothetical protein R3C18_16030 [Planctomycetaceae bacterium]